jgi:hypothetical protein
MENAREHWPLVLFIVATGSCVIGAFWFGREPDGESVLVRLRNRARYLRWLSMACLGAMGAMVASGVHAIEISGDDKGKVAIASVAMAGLVAVVLASVYRYIVRLAYFFEARADAFQLLDEVAEDELRGVRALAQLTAILSPERVAFESVGSALKGMAPVPLGEKRDREEELDELVSVLADVRLKKSNGASERREGANGK